MLPDYKQMLGWVLGFQPELHKELVNQIVE